MTDPRRMGTENSETRRRLLDIAQRLLLQEGANAVGIRRVAREAEVTPALVLYYFRDLDDLFVALMRRGADQEIERQTHILESGEPLRGLWELSAQPGTTVIGEFMALANHRPAIRAEFAAHAVRYREALLKSLEQGVDEGRLDLSGLSPMAVIVLITAVSRTLVMENAIGLTSGHQETLALVEQLLRGFDDARPPAPGNDRTDDAPDAYSDTKPPA